MSWILSEHLEPCNNWNVRQKSFFLLASELDNSHSVGSHMGAVAIYATQPFDAITSLVMVYQPSVTSECLMIYMNQSMLLHSSTTHTTQ